MAPKLFLAIAFPLILFLRDCNETDDQVVDSPGPIQILAISDAAGNPLGDKPVSGGRSVMSFRSVITANVITSGTLHLLAGEYDYGVIAQGQVFSLV